MGSSDQWDALGERFVATYDTLYGQVRTHVIHHHLLDHLPPPPARIVDVAGGAGQQAIELARAGYDVLIIDSSEAQLRRADQNIRTAGVSGSVSCELGDAFTATKLVDSDRFAGVLNHGFLQYQNESRPTVEVLAGLAAPNGVVSIMTYNLHWNVMRAGQALDWEEVLTATEGGRKSVNYVGAASRGYDPTKISEELREHAVDTLAVYGLRTFTEGWSREHSVVPEDSLVLKAELKLSRLSPYREMSRAFHVVGKRSQSPARMRAAR